MRTQRLMPLAKISHIKPPTPKPELPGFAGFTPPLRGLYKAGELVPRIYNAPAACLR